MPTMDRIQDNQDINDQSSADLSEEQAHLYTSSDNLVAIKMATNQSDSIKLHDVQLDDFSANAGTASSDKVNALLQKKIAEPATDINIQAEAEKALSRSQPGLSRTMDADEANKVIQMEAAVQMQLEAEAYLRLRGGEPLQQAVDRLRSVAGNNLPENFEEKMADWIYFQEKQRLGNDEAERLGMTDDEGRRLHFPCAGDTQEELRQNLANALDRFSDAYELHEQGGLSGSALDGYGSDDAWLYDWQSIVTACLDPVGEDDQAQIGSCAMNTEFVPGWVVDPGAMADVHMQAITKGVVENDDGNIIARVYADELGRGDTLGQKPSVFIFCSLLSSATYGDNGSGRGTHHRNGNNVGNMDDGMESLIGWSVSNIDGAYHKFSPGHSMVALNEVGGDGIFYKVQHNHWNGIGFGEPGEGIDYRYRHEIDLSGIDIAVT